MLGPFEVRTDDGVVADVPGARLRALLIALALEPGHAVPKATLIDWICPPIRAEQGKDRARGNIQTDATEHDLVPYALRSPVTAIAELVMRPLSTPPRTRPCHVPDTTTDTAFCLVAPGRAHPPTRPGS